MTEGHSATFSGLGIAPKILETLQKLKFTVPTPIQYKAIPSAIEGSDIMGIAQTGTGKTLAFGIPLVQRLAQKGGQALVLVPTRELAYQVDETIRKIAQPFGMRTLVIIGGASMGFQIEQLRRKPAILVATPGRLADHLQQRNVELSGVNMLVLDEADRMMDMGFAPQIEKIVRQVPKDRQTLLFSATMPDNIVRAATSYMKLPIRVETARSGTVADKVTQELFIVRNDLKRELLAAMLAEHRGSVLLFTRTKHGARKVAHSVRAMGHASAEIHSNRSLNQRREALEGFKCGKYRVLVATDIASRGIDVKGIEVVINYDLPEDAENYVHRIGRTGRAGMEGKAISFATPDQESDVRAIEKLMRLTLRVASHPKGSETFQRGHHAPRPQHQPSNRPQGQGHRPGGPGRPGGGSARPGGSGPSRFGGRPGGFRRFSGR